MRALLLLLCFATVAVAQPRQGPQKPGDTQGAQDRREAIKKRIRVMRAATLTDELKLDEKTLSRLLPVLAKYDDVTEDLLKKRVAVIARLNAADTVKDPKAVDKIVDEAVAIQRAFWDLEEKRLAELRKILTPPQIAKLLVVLPEFERRIQNQLARAIRNANGGGGRRGRRAGGGGNSDDDIESDEDPQPRRR
jgi:hypothetical protein